MLKTSLDIVNLVSSSRDTDVYLCAKKETGDRFLLKSLKEPSDGSPGETVQRKIRFRREVDIVSAFDHPNIARPAETFSDEKTFSILYPYCNGVTLARIFEEKTSLSVFEALTYTLQTLDALEYIHARGIIHCDLNPHNIFITEDKGVELLDFGLSLTEEEARKMPEGRIIGTLPYLSPEQMGFTDFKIDTRSDLFCAGIILYRMISGDLPFSNAQGSLEELLNFTLKTEVNPVKNIPAYLNSMLLKALKPSPEDRYQTATGFHNDVELALSCVKEEGKKTFTPGERDAIIAVNRAKVFIGRDTEVSSLSKGMEQLDNGHGTSFLIYGKSGVGKTEIVGQFKNMIDEEKFAFLSSKCNRFSSSQPYSIVRHIVHELLFKINQGVGFIREEFKNNLDSELSEFSGVISSIIPELGPYFEIVGEIDKVEKEKEAERIIYVLSRLMNTIFKIKKTIISIDDFQWIDQISFEVLKKLLAQPLTCMLVFCYRTEKSDTDIFNYGSDLGKIGIKKLFQIKSFSRTEVEDLISSRIGHIQQSEKLVDAICSKTDGNPFTVAEAMRYLVNTSVLQPSTSGWVYKESDLLALPEKFDAVSLVLSKLDTLEEEVKRFLMTASLIQGRVETAIVHEIGGFDPEATKKTLRLLENLGFIVRKSNDAFYFSHDKIQESVASKFSKDEAFVLNEKIATVFELKISKNNEFIFSSAEYFLKSKNITKAITICYEAAKYAVEKTAFEIATRYFKNTMLMASRFAGSSGLPVPVDLIKVQIDFGNVLMLTGRNQQALNIFLKLLENPSVLDHYQQLELKYCIGSIYHNMGDFENSVKYFTNTLKQKNVKLPENKVFMGFSLCFQVIKQILFAFGLKYLLSKNKNPDTNLTLRIMNKLSYSLYFQDVLLGIYVHLKALNLADILSDRYEKAEAYVFHIVGAYHMFLKKRAFRYFNKSLKIATSIHRKDLISFAKCFGGITYYYDAKWKDAEKYLVQSISDYKSVGDVWGQLTPLEHLGYLAFNNGIFEKCITKMQEEGTLSKECNDIRGTILSKRMIALVQLLEGKNKESDWEELKKTVSQMKDSLINTMANISLSTKALLTEKIIESFEISKKSLETIKEKNLNQEYIASAFSTHCEILIAEKRNRIADESKKQLDLSDKRLLNQLKSHSHKAFLRGIVYPAHLGAAFRSLAWSFYFKGHERLATFFFVQAIKKHHVLDMRYEEAKSRRDYGLFLEACNFSGEARDQFNAAYRLFHACGAILETERLKDKVDIIPFEPKTIEARKIESSETSTFEVSQFRIDTLYEVSSSMREIDDLDTLLKQMLAAMIKATGAQYGCVFLEGNKENDYVNKSMAMNFDGTMLNLKEVYCSEKIIADTKKQKKIILVKNSLETGLNRDDTERVRSVLCVPLCHGESYQGCVYLANNIVSSLFSETSKKAVQILSAQADILLQNAYLMAEFKKLNRNLEKKVREQTNDIQEKNKQLAEYNVKVVESERMKGLLTGTLVHDIKNSVSGIEGNAELLNRSFPNEPKVKKMVTIVADCCASIVSLASNLLDIGKMEEGKLLIKKEQLGVKNIFAIADHLKKNAMFEEKCVIVSLVDNTNDTFVIDADYYLVDRVLQNLLSNAVKYVPRNGNVTLSLETFGEENIICCYNSGAPIQDEYKNVLFDKYARVDSKASQYSKGLGLFFSKMVMNAHNGRIWLDTDKTGNYFKLSFKKRNINFLNSTSPAA